MNNTAKLIFATFAAAIPTTALAETRGNACPEYLGNSLEQGTFTVLSESFPVTIQINGGELQDTVVSLSYDTIHFAKGTEKAEMALEQDSVRKKGNINNVFEQNLSCSAMFLAFGGNNLLVGCGNTIINLTDTDISVQMKDNPTRSPDKWCESHVPYQGPAQP